MDVQYSAVGVIELDIEEGADINEILEELEDEIAKLLDIPSSDIVTANLLDIGGIQHNNPPIKDLNLSSGGLRIMVVVVLNTYDKIIDVVTCFILYQEGSQLQYQIL